MKTRVIGRRDLAAIVSAVGLDRLMDEMIEALVEAVRNHDDERTDVRRREGFHYREPDVGLLEWMPVMDAGNGVTIKVVGYHPTNPARRGIPTILSTISAYDAVTGHLAGLTDGTFATALRTGAASAVASRILANPDSRTLGLLGCGAQAVTQAHALLRSFPINRILVHDIDPRSEATFAERLSPVLPTGISVGPAPMDVVVGEADILCTTTSIPVGGGPLFDELDTVPWLHVNAVGADFPGKCELPKSLLESSLVCPDDLAQAMAEGECQQLEPDQIGPSLASLVAHPEAYRDHLMRRTVYDSTGWALQDQAAVRLLMRHAASLDVGMLVELEDVGGDPLDPYAIARPDARPEVA